VNADGSEEFTDEWGFGGKKVTAEDGSSVTLMTDGSSKMEAEDNVHYRRFNDFLKKFGSPNMLIALAEGDRSILPAAPGHPILVSARSGGLPGLASYYVQTVGAVPGPWAFKDDVWVSEGSVAGCGGPYHDFLTSPDYIVSAAGEVSLSVDHRHAFEGAMWDAGQLWISVNGGAYADVGKDAFSANGYTDVAIIGNNRFYPACFH